MKKLLFLCIILVLKAHAQQPAHFPFALEQFRGAHIYDVIQDKEGSYFFATNRGIVMHDGYKFEKLLNEDMRGESVFGFVKDSAGNIYCYNHRQQVLVIADGRVDVLFEIPADYAYPDVWLELDNDHQPVVQTNALFKVLGKESPEVIDNLEFNRGSSPITLFRLSSGDLISVTLSLDFIIYDGNSARRFQSEMMSNLRDQGTISNLSWMNLGMSTYVVDLKSRNLYNFEQTSLSFEFVKTLDHVDKSDGLRLMATKNHIWLTGNYNGAYLFDLNFNPLYGGRKIFSDYFISDIYMDQEGNTLLSTFNDGVLVIPEGDVLSLTLGNKEKMISLATDGIGSLFIGSNLGNVYHFDGRNLNLVHSNPQKKAVEFLDFWREQSMLIHASGVGAEFSKWNDGKLMNAGNYGGAIKDFFAVDSTKALAAFNRGIVEVDAGDGSPRFAMIPELKQRSYCIGGTPDGQFILAGLMSGLEIFARGDTILKVQDVDVTPIKFLKTRRAMVISTQNNGMKGFREGALTDFCCPLNNVRDVKVSSQDLFFLTTEGMFSSPEDSREPQYIDRSSGHTCDRVSAFEILGDRIYFTDSEVLQAIPLNRLSTDKPSFDLAFRSVTTTSGEQAGSQIPYNQNEITFDFATTTLKYRSDITYDYRLIGFQDEWKSLPYSDNSVTYNALGPGNYTFEVKTRLGNTNGKVLTYQFNVLPPFYLQLWFIALALAFVVGLVSWLYLLRIRNLEKKNRDELDRQRIISDQLESELKALRSQMNPHFIFNSLNAIQELILKEDTDASYDYIVLFSDLVRNTLSYSNKEYIPLEKEVEFLHIYLKLEKLRFKRDFDYTIDTGDVEEVDVPSLLIQPFVENALLHGLLHKEGPKVLSVRFELKDQLICYVEDEGIGRVRAQAMRDRQGTAGNSFALQAIEKRMQILNEKAKERIGYFEMEDLFPDKEDTGTRVTIHLPFKRRY